MFGISKYIMGGMALVIGVMALAFWLYFKSSQATIASLNQDLATSQAAVATLKGAVQEQNESIIRLEKQREVDQQKINDLVLKNREAAREVDILRKKLDHDFYKSTLAHPDWVEKIINKGSDKVLRDLEELSNYGK